MRPLLSAIAALATLPAVALSWETDMELTWPKPHAQEIHETTRSEIAFESERDYFPCRHIKPPKDVKRVPWPINGAGLQFNRTWTGEGPASTEEVDTWSIYPFFGQFQGLSTEYIKKPIWEFEYTWGYPDTGLGSWCTQRTPRLSEVYEDGSSLESGSEFIDRNDVPGVNATLGIRWEQSSNSDEAGGVRVVLQCVYVQFTTATNSTGPCKLNPYDDPESDDYGGGFVGESAPIPDGYGTTSLVNVDTVLIIALCVGLPILALVLFACMRCHKQRTRDAEANSVSAALANPIALQRIIAETEERNKTVGSNGGGEQLPAYSGPPPEYQASPPPRAGG